MVNRRSRYLIDVIRSSYEDTLFIYDYSSFTSTLHEIRNFTAALARYFDDVYVKVVDTYHGVVEVSVGQLLSTFNQTCNVDPKFDTWKFEGPEYDRVEGVFPESFHNAGMLGVPGNISSCTLLHGLHLAVLVLSMESCRVVGDDAVGSKLIHDLFTFVLRLQNIGSVSISKSIHWSGGVESEGVGWHYTKRPIERVENRVLFGFQAVFPPLASLYCVEDSLHDTFYPETVVGRIIRATKFLNSFTRQFSFLPSLDSSEEEFAEDFIESCVRGIYRWTRHSVSKVSDVRRHLSSVPRSLGFDSFEEIIHARRGEIVYMPPDSSHFSRFDPEVPCCIGETYCVLVNRSVRLAVDMFWAESEEVLVAVVLGDSNFDEYLNFCCGNVRSVCRITFDDACPSWFLRFFSYLNNVDVPIDDYVM